MDKTYSEKRDIPPFDWNICLDELMAGKELSAELHKHYVSLAANWVTCACGNQCAILPRNLNGVPYDHALYGLGHYFYIQIKGASWSRAKETLQKIEARAHTLIQEILKNKNEKITTNDWNHFYKE